jgi:hypothetical protein
VTVIPVGHIPSDKDEVHRMLGQALDEPQLLLVSLMEMQVADMKNGHALRAFRKAGEHDRAPGEPVAGGSDEHSPYPYAYYGHDPAQEKNIHQYTASAEYKLEIQNTKHETNSKRINSNAQNTRGRPRFGF